MKTLAKDFYMQGYSCSESIIKAASVKGIVHEDLIKIATAFSGGMSSGCLCGAVAGAQIVLSSLKGRTSNSNDSSECRALAKEFIDEFKAKNKFTCCKVLTRNLESGSPERKANCARLVEDAAGILDELVVKVKV